MADSEDHSSLVIGYYKTLVEGVLSDLACSVDFFAPILLFLEKKKIFE